MTQLALDNNAQLTTSYRGAELFESEAGEPTYANIFNITDNSNRKMYFVAVTNDARQSQSDTRNFAEQIQFVGQVLGLNNSQIARVANVGRATLYTHINGESVPNSATGELYKKLYRLAIAVENVEGLQQKQKLRSVMVDGDTVLGHLMQPDWNVDEIIGFIRRVADEDVTKSPSSVSTTERVRRTRHLTKMG